MNDFAATAARAADLLLTRDPAAMAAIGLSFEAAFAATLTAVVLGVPLGLIVGTVRFRGRALVQALLQALLAVPTVVIGLVLYLLLSRRGPLGSFELLFTPAAIIFGQVLLAFPVVAAFTAAAARAADVRTLETALTLGATRARALLSLAAELRLPLIAAIAAAFGRVISEVGVAMIVGGNIRGQTRTMTTSIALETAKGDFALALALGAILLVASIAINLVAMRGRR